MPTPSHHKWHIPYHIVHPAWPSEYVALAQCSCGYVAWLSDYDVGPWKKSQSDSFFVKWALVEAWSEPGEDERRTLAATKGDDDGILGEALSTTLNYE